MDFYSMIPVSISQEFLSIARDGHRCHLTPEQQMKVQEQVEKVWGEVKIMVSIRGVVFSDDDPCMTLGRIDANFNFYKK